VDSPGKSPWTASVAPAEDERLMALLARLEAAGRRRRLTRTLTIVLLAAVCLAAIVLATAALHWPLLAGMAAATGVVYCWLELAGLLRRVLWRRRMRGVAAEVDAMGEAFVLERLPVLADDWPMAAGLLLDELRPAQFGRPPAGT
jgi:hypothetical protein